MVVIVHAGQFTDVYQRIAMHAMELIGELGFQVLERIFDQHFTLAMAYGDVFLFGLEIINVIDRHQHQVAAHPAQICRRDSMVDSTSLLREACARVGFDAASSAETRRSFFTGFSR